MKFPMLTLHKMQAAAKKRKEVIPMCTSFAVYAPDNMIYGMNFDTDEIDLKLRVLSYKDRNIFYFSGLIGGNYRDVAGFNSEGLFICTQAVQYSPGIHSSCDVNDWTAFAIFDDVLKNCRKASEFMEILKKRNISYPRNPLFPDLDLHTMIADQTGDAFILEVGKEENVISPIKNKFVVMTNFPNGDFKDVDYDKVYGIGADRYICAHEYIQNHLHSFGVHEAFEALSNTHREDTLCSIVYVPIKNEIYISFKKDFSKKWMISLSDKTIQSLNGVFSNNIIHITGEEVLVKDLTNLY